MRIALFNWFRGLEVLLGLWWWEGGVFGVLLLGGFLGVVEEEERTEYG